jgi:hypothetical protein
LRKFGFIFIVLLNALFSKAQPGNCILKPPQITIHFGAGNVRDVTIGDLSYYTRVPGSCPSDGHYSLASSTSGCFSDDWHTISEDHTPGDVHGNMLLVNAGVEGAIFLRTPIAGLKSNTIYEIGFWLMNLCKPTKKCPTLILPNLTIRLETPDGKAVATIGTGDVPRVEQPWWTPHRAYFTTPASTSTLMLVMVDNMHGGCGNDFALDDITFRECVKQTTRLTSAPKTTSTRRPSTAKSSPKKITSPEQKKPPVAEVISPKSDSSSKTISIAKQNPRIVPSTPSVLRTRENALARRIETDAGEIRIDVYDNGEIDGDSVTIYHNNALVTSHMRLSGKPISFTISVNPSQPHHEIIMVADNLGLIPPNTSVMIVTTDSNRYEVFISSDKQKNAKVVLDLKKTQ